MNLQLHLVATNIRNDFREYFLRIEASVSKLAGKSAGLREAWLLCEYLDAADSENMPVDPRLYAYAREALTDFLVSYENHRNLEALCARSWAASTLMAIIDKARFATETVCHERQDQPAPIKGFVGRHLKRVA